MSATLCFVLLNTTLHRRAKMGTLSQMACLRMTESANRLAPLCSGVAGRDVVTFDMVWHRVRFVGQAVLVDVAGFITGGPQYVCSFEQGKVKKTLPASEQSSNTFEWGFSRGFVRRPGTTRAEGPHVGPQHVRGAKRNRVDQSRAHGLFYRSFPGLVRSR